MLHITEIKKRFTIETIVNSYDSTGYIPCKLTYMQKVNDTQHACIVPALLSHLCRPISLVYDPSFQEWELYCNEIGRSFFIGLMDGWNGWFSWDQIESEWDQILFETDDELLNYGRELGKQAAQILNPQQIKL
jgi:hypothetical protein